MSDKWDLPSGQTQSEPVIYKHSLEHLHRPTQHDINTAQVRNAVPGHAEGVNSVHTTDLPSIPKYVEPAQTTVTQADGVHFVDHDGTEHAAIVKHVHSAGVVNLHVLNNHKAHHDASSVQHSLEKKPYSWHHKHE